MNARLRRLARSILARLSKRHALFQAIERGDVGVAGEILAAGASPNASNADGVTALILASSLGRVEIVQALLKRGADPTRSTSRGCIAYDFARHRADVHYAAWAAERFGVQAMPVDGETLSGTADDSVDLVIANNVLAFVPPIKIWSYMTEMRRIVRKDGIVLFNLVLSDQLDESYLRRYLDS